MTKLSCKSPLVHLNLGPNGHINLCCENRWTIRTHIDEIDDLEEFFNSSVMDYHREEITYKGNIKNLDSCKNCYWNTMKGDETFRSRLEKYHTFPNEANDKKAREYGINVPIRYLEYTLSNICNQKCAMCSSFFSNKWQDLDKELGREVHPLQKLGDDAISKIEKVLYGLDYLEIKGGEPFADIRNFRILKKLAEVNNKCEIKIVSNMHHITPEAMDILKKFPNIKLFASVDGTNKIYDWIRGGNFKKTVDTMEKYYNETGNKVQIGTTISLFNFFNLLDIQNYFEDKEYINNIVFENWCRSTKDGMPDIVGKDIYDEQIKIYKKKLKNFVPKEYENKDTFNFKSNFDKLNIDRGFDITDHVPELKEWYNRK
jgi:hypothetical protein